MKNITVRLNEQDYELLREKVKKSGMTQAEFLRRMIQNSKAVSTIGIKKFIPELAKIGNNINQIAKKSNQGIMPSYHLLKREMDILNTVLHKVLMFLNGKALELELSDDIKKRIDCSVKEWCEQILNTEVIIGNN